MEVVMSRPLSRKSSLRLEVLEDRSAPAALGLGHFPAEGLAGLTKAVGHVAPQGVSHSPALQQVSTTPPLNSAQGSNSSQAAAPTLPDAATPGIQIALGRNAAQASHSPLF